LFITNKTQAFFNATKKYKQFEANANRVYPSGILWNLVFTLRKHQKDCTSSGAKDVATIFDGSEAHWRAYDRSFFCQNHYYRLFCASVAPSCFIEQMSSFRDGFYLLIYIFCDYKNVFDQKNVTHRRW